MKLTLPLSLILALSSLAAAAGTTAPPTGTAPTTAQTAPPAPGAGQPGRGPGMPGRGPDRAGPRESAQQLQARIDALSRQTTDADARRLLTEARTLLTRAGQGAADSKYLRAARDLLHAAEVLSGTDPRGAGRMGPGAQRGPATPGAPTAPTPPTGK